MSNKTIRTYTTKKNFAAARKILKSASKRAVALLDPRDFSAKEKLTGTNTYAILRHFLVNEMTFFLALDAAWAQSKYVERKPKRKARKSGKRS